MDYTKIYNSLISRSLSRTINSKTYYEKHHIIPKCVGGSDDISNLVWLYPEEHYLAHQLLVKMYPKEHKLINAAVMMTVDSIGNRINNKLYGWLRRKFSEIMSVKQTGEQNHQFGTVWITDGSISKKIKLTDDIMPGWYKGRIIPNMRKPQRSNTCSVCGIHILKKRGRLCDQHFRESKIASGKRLYISGKGSYEHRVFITDGVNDKLHPKNDPIPDGFRRGRSNNKRKTKKI